MEKEWGELTPDEKQEALFQKCLAAEGVEFASPAAEKDYRDRLTRLKDAVQMKKVPDRVPILPITSFFPAFYGGITPYEAMYDYEKMVKAFKKFIVDFAPDANTGAGTGGAGRILELVDYKQYAWPGHGVSPLHSYQCLEKEYMMADEYDELIKDPSHFFTNSYLPRIFGKLEGFKMLPNFTHFQELPFVGPNLIPFGLPDVQAAYKALFEAGEEALKWAGYLAEFDKEISGLGFPSIFGGFSKVPFDVIGDTLRGTRGIMVDIYRQPEKVLEALEAITPIMIDMGVSVVKMSGKPGVLIPLHKGADGFLSDAQFKKFYWPYFKKLLDGLIEEGCVPFSFVEGGYNTRLEVIKDIPKGKTIWSFDTTDMAKAKKTVGQVACIGGNVPTDLLAVGTPQQVKDYVKNLIDTCAPGGGYIMANGVAADEVKAENLKMMIDLTKEYGVYK
jgi:hypothetical protein